VHQSRSTNHQSGSPPPPALRYSRDLFVHPRRISRDNYVLILVRSPHYQHQNWNQHGYYYCCCYFPTYLCVNIHIHIYINVYVYIHIYIYTSIYTSIHTCFINNFPAPVHRASLFTTFVPSGNSYGGIIKADIKLSLQLMRMMRIHYMFFMHVDLYIYA
jgi:hypothetical protein